MALELGTPITVWLLEITGSGRQTTNRVAAPRSEMLAGSTRLAMGNPGARPAAAFGRRCIWDRHGRHPSPAFFQPDVMFPVVVEVVLVEKALLNPKLKIGEPDVFGLVVEHHPAPAQGDLNAIVEVGYGLVAPQQQALPDHGMMPDSATLNWSCRSTHRTSL